MTWFCISFYVLSKTCKTTGKTIAFSVVTIGDEEKSSVNPRHDY